MASILGVSMTTFFFIAVIVHVTNAENPLINVTCDVAEAPETCMECMYSDPRKDKADAVLLAVIVVDCATTHAELLRGNMSDWASSIKNQVYKEAVEDCSTMFSNAKEDLFAATTGLKKGDYDGADRSVYNASMLGVACHRRRIKSTRGSIEALPMEVYYELGIYNQLDHRGSYEDYQ